MQKRIKRLFFLDSTPPLPAWRVGGVSNYSKVIKKKKKDTVSWLSFQKLKQSMSNTLN